RGCGSTSARQRASGAFSTHVSPSWSSASLGSRQSTPNKSLQRTGHANKGLSSFSVPLRVSRLLSSGVRQRRWRQTDADALQSGPGAYLAFWGWLAFGGGGRAFSFPIFASFDDSVCVWVCAGQTADPGACGLPDAPRPGKTHGGGSTGKV